MKKYLVPLMLAACTGIFILFGCGDRKERDQAVSAFMEPLYEWGKSSEEVIVIWGDETDLSRSYMIRAFERYQLFTGNKLDIKKFSAEEMEQNLARVFESDSQEKPDILLSYGGRNLDRLHPDDNLYDFTDAVWVDDLTGTAINQTIYNGKVVGLPYWEASISGTLYNKDIFNKFGLEIPTTQSEFMKVCETLKENGVIPLYLPYEKGTMLLYQFPMDSIVQESSTLSALNEGTLSYSQIPSMGKILEWYKDMSEKGYLGDNYVNNGWDGMSEALSSEKYAMMLCWDTWLYSDFKGDATKFGLMPAFMGVPDGGSFEGPNLSLLLVNKNSKRVDAALDLITFMADPYNYNEAFKGLYTAPIFKNQVESISTPQYTEAERLIEKHFYDSTAWLRISGFSQVDAAYIQTFMQDDNYSVKDCLRDMDDARKKRAAESYKND